MAKIHISGKNSKLGMIPNISLTPGTTCSAEACKTCYNEGCYAMKAYRIYKQVRAAWDENTELALHDISSMKAQLLTYFSGMNAPRYFRIHVGGDFVTPEYAAMWAEIAERCPFTNFLAFTKQWDTVRDIVWPSNVSIVLSAWPGTEIPADLRDKFSIAWLDDGETDIPDNALECPGNCETCGVCWGLAKRGIDVRFKKH